MFVQRDDVGNPIAVRFPVSVGNALLHYPWTRAFVSSFVPTQSPAGCGFRGVGCTIIIDREDKEIDSHLSVHSI